MTAENAQEAPRVSAGVTFLVRLFGWTVLGALAAYLANNYLTYWMQWPGPGAVLGIGGKQETSYLSWLQLSLYAFFFVQALIYVRATSRLTLREDCARVSALNTFLIRAAFFAVLYIGVVDAVLSFMRVEGLLPVFFGDHYALELGRSQFRGPWVHMPLSALAIVTAIFSRTLGFTWLALLIVVAELGIVITRFIFSYEQGFMGDLVRFWYAALFLFASAYTLIEEGHVRVDVFYSAFSAKRRGLVNAMGSMILGMTLCWIILTVGMGGANSVINAPLLNWETTQTGFSMYVKYMMAGFLAVFAISMMIQFVSYMMESVADVRGEPGGRDHSSHSVA
ncbi:MAG: permease [Rhodospirillales bacterium CG15_BIG_FIL_POST_REV_8_21_14_020_66_15]|nr:MAG: permease [Rhodospirillales bacterium CG15_BIG_FIL_POST_REV_8_21_14_020_66_15]